MLNKIRKIKNFIDIKNSPQNLTMNTKGDFRKKLEEGIEDSENGNIEKQIIILKY